MTIPKGTKDHTVPDNNRGITLMPVLGKVLDSLLLKRVDGWITSTLDELQGANRRGVSSLETAACLQEFIAQNVSRGRTVYIALLDVRKAFDTVWHAGLFVQLHDLGLDPKIWRILRDSYSNFKCAVRVGSHLSTWFEPQQGVHQGDVFSMRLHSLYSNKLLLDLRAEVMDAIIGPVNCGQPVFADDIAIASTTKTVIKKKIRTCVRYGNKWRYDFSPPKTYLLVFGRDHQPEIHVTLYGQTLQVVKSHLHVGVPLCSSSAAEVALVTDRIKACRRKFYMIEGASGARHRMSPLTMSRIYQAVCIPALCYGAEVWTPSQRSLQELEKMHMQLGRRTQGLPALSTSAPASHSTLGWLTIEAIFDLSKLLWVLRLLRLPYTSPYNRMALWCFNRRRFSAGPANICGPFEVVYDVAAKYGLLDHIHTMMDTATLVSRDTWKRLCNQVVRDRQCRRWHMTRGMYQRLDFFNQVITTVDPVVWWTVCKNTPESMRHCVNVVRLITGENCLNMYRGKYMYGPRTSVCGLCDMFVDETVEHLLTTCSALTSVRDSMWEEVKTLAPHGMLISLDEMSLHDRTLFLCSGFRCPYVRVWQPLYQAVARFISALYRTRCELMKQYK